MLKLPLLFDSPFHMQLTYASSGGKIPVGALIDYRCCCYHPDLLHGVREVQGFLK